MRGKTLSEFIDSLYINPKWKLNTLTKSISYLDIEMMITAMC